MIVTCDTQKPSERELNILNVEKLMQTKYTLEMRLIPINKVKPNIPTEKELRPIYVQSLVIKLIELFYTNNLQRKMRYNIGTDQVGFVSGSGVQINLWQIVELAKLNAPRKAQILLILSNAYNTVNRARLYEIITKRGWIDLQTAKFYLHCMMKCIIGILQQNKGCTNAVQSVFQLDYRDMEDKGHSESTYHVNKETKMNCIRTQKYESTIIC